jgi:hypothetical protein
MFDQPRARRNDPAPTFIEPLEDRRLLSGGSIHAAAAAAPTTTTTLHVSKQNVFTGQDVIVTATVKSKNGPKATGNLEILDNGTPLQNLSGDPLIFTLSKGKVKYLLGAGDVALFTGSHSLSAEFLGNPALPTSTSSSVPVNVAQPALITTSTGLQYATVKKGHGKPVTAGKTARVAYTGFLASNGDIFDYATGHGSGSTPYFDFHVLANPEEVIPGFDQGVAGMKVGEERAIFIPSALGYGPTGSGSIPPNADLVFLVRLLAFG